ncbi:hypothetical protein TKK_0003607 [Trichogramma kaykai]
MSTQESAVLKYFFQEATEIAMKLKNNLKSIENMEIRYKTFYYRGIKHFSANDRVRCIVVQIIKDQTIFPCVEEFLTLALQDRELRIVKFLVEVGIKIHEFKFEDGKSALHYLLEQEVIRSENDIKGYRIQELVNFFLQDLRENRCDDTGYTYFHGACMAGIIPAVHLFLSQGVNVNLDTYTCSPLHVATQYRRKDVIEILLRHGANPNQRDHEQSTPLHALARLYPWECNTNHICGDYKKQVKEIVEMIINSGADIEASNCHGDTPLQVSVSCFDVELTKSLLKHKANLLSLNQNRMFNMKFETIEMKNYPLTFNIIQVIELLQSQNYVLNFETRWRMLKCWMRVRGKDGTNLISYAVEKNEYRTYVEMNNQIHFHEKFGFFIKQEAIDYFHEEIEKLTQTMPPELINHRPSPTLINRWELEIAKLDKIMINNKISLYKMCQMDYSKAYSIIKDIKNWSVPSLDQLEHDYLSLIVKRHIANIFIRRQLELFAADLFMTEQYKLNLPYVVCRIVAEKMSDEDLFRLVDQMENKNLADPFLVQRNTRQFFECMSDEIRKTETYDETNEENLAYPLQVRKKQRLN